MAAVKARKFRRRCGRARAVGQLFLNADLVRNALVIAVCLFASGCHSPWFVQLPLNPSGPAYLRIQNETGGKILDVVFQKNLFGDIEASGLTQYQEAAHVPTTGNITLLPGDHDWTEISLRIPGQTDRIRYFYVDWPDRFVQSPGHWTFVLTLSDSYAGQGKWLNIKPKKDD